MESFSDIECLGMAYLHRWRKNQGDSWATSPNQWRVPIYSHDMYDFIWGLCLTMWRSPTLYTTSSLPLSDRRVPTLFWKTKEGPSNHVDSSSTKMGCYIPRENRCLNFEFECVLVQLGEYNLDYPTLLACCQLNKAEVKCMSTKRQVLSMMYDVQKLSQYLLATKFIFFVDHWNLLYLVNKACEVSHITWWMQMLMDFDFIVIVLQRFQACDGQSSIMCT